MTVSKISTYAAFDVEQNKKDRVRVLGRRTRQKTKRHSPPASISGSSTNELAAHLEKRRGQRIVIVFKVKSYTFGNPS